MKKSPHQVCVNYPFDMLITYFLVDGGASAPVIHRSSSRSNMPSYAIDVLSHVDFDTDAGEKYVDVESDDDMAMPSIRSQSFRNADAKLW